jgi:hypothetical protein
MDSAGRNRIPAAGLPGHPFAPFRRIGQQMLYRWYHLRDEAT